MTDNVSDNLALPYLQPSQAQKHVTHNEALTRLDILVQFAVGATGPAELPEAGEVHALGNDPIGAWAGHGDGLSAWTGTAWMFVQPRPGWSAAAREGGALRVWTGSQWVMPPLDGLDRLGINASADATNRLSLAEPPAEPQDEPQKRRSCAPESGWLRCPVTSAWRCPPRRAGRVLRAEWNGVVAAHPRRHRVVPG